MNHPRWAAMTAIALGLSLQTPLAAFADPTVAGDSAQSPGTIQSQPQASPMTPAPNGDDQVLVPDAGAPGASDEDQSPNANDEGQSPNANDEDQPPGSNDEDTSPGIPPGEMPRQPDASGGIRV